MRRYKNNSYLLMLDASIILAILIAIITLFLQPYWYNSFFIGRKETFADSLAFEVGVPVLTMVLSQRFFFFVIKKIAR